MPDAPDAWTDLTELRELSRPLAVPAAVRPRRDRRTLWRVLLVAVLPALLAAGYFDLIAVDRYVAEAHFVVREPNAPGRMMPMGGALADLPKSTGSENAYAVHDFIRSRDGLALLQGRLDLRALLRPAAGDPLWRFPGPLLGHDQEDLYRYYRRLVTLDYNSSTNVSTLTVQAFRPDDAVRIADILIGGAETLLNRMNERARADAIRVAEAEVTASRAEALAAEDAMTEYRNREQVVDPLQLSQTVLATISKLTEDLVTAAAEFDVAVHEAPHSPQLPALRGRIEALQTQIDHERGVLAGSDRSLAPRIGAYERLLLLRGFAEKRYVSALTLLETARLDAERQAAYLERVVTARPPDQARYPFRLLWPVATLLVGLLLVRLFRPATLLPPRSLHGT